MKSIETPEEFEKTTLEMYIKSLESKSHDKPKAYIFVVIFIILSAALFIAVYVLQKLCIGALLLRYFLCVLAGILIGGAIIVTKLSCQSQIMCKYIDIEAIKNRINEIDNLPKTPKSNGAEWK